MWVEGALSRLGLSYQLRAKVRGSRAWDVECLAKYLYPIVVEVLDLSRASPSDFYLKLFKLLDLQRSLGAKPILAVSGRGLSQEDLDVASSYGVYVVLDEAGLAKAVEGEEVGRVNSLSAKKLVRRASRGLAEGCRRSILELLASRALTREELALELSGSFPKRTVETQLRVLVKRGLVKSVARRPSGEAIYASSAGASLACDASRRSKRGLVKQAILRALKESPRPLSLSMLASMVGLSGRLYYIAPIVHQLRREGLVERAEGGWALRPKGG